MNAKLTKYITCLCLLTGIGCFGQQQERNIIRESQIPSPEYFGFYAITPKGLIEIKQGSSASIPTLGTDVEFINYSKNSTDMDYYTMYKTPSRQEVEKREQQRSKNTQNYSGLSNFAQQSMDNYNANNAALSGLPQGSQKIDFRQKPITGKSDSIRIIPSSNLTPGSYQLGAGSNPELWYRFTVSSYVGQIGVNDMSQGSQNPPQPIQQPPSEIRVTDYASGQSIAVVKATGFEIQKKELDASVSAQLANSYADIKPNSDQLLAVRKQCLTNLIKVHLLVLKATHDEVNQGRSNGVVQIANMQNQYASKREFARELKAQGIIQDELKERLGLQQIAKLVVNRELGDDRTPESSQAYIQKLWDDYHVEILDLDLK